MERGGALPGRFHMPGKLTSSGISLAGQISKIPREPFAPAAIDGVFQDMVKFLVFERTGQNMYAYLMKVGMLRQEAGARVILGSGFPDEFVSVHCTQNAALTLASLGDTSLGDSLGQFRRP